MVSQKLEKMLMDDIFVSDVHAIRKNGTTTFSSSEEARDFFVKFLVLETMAGVNYTGEELLSAYYYFDKSVEPNKVFSSKKIPYHPLKKRPSSEKKFIWDGKCCCTIQ